MIVKKGNNYAYDFVVKIGRLRYLEKYQIQEIEEKIKAEMNIKISQTQIRRLCYLFLFYLGKYHYSQSSKISENMSKKGGYILHIRHLS